MNPRVGVIGSLNADLSVAVERHPRPGETVLGTGGHLTPGGKGGNQALAAAHQGIPTLMVGAIGTDAHAEVTTRLLREADVDLRHVVTVPGPTGLAIVAVDPNGENNIIVVPGANARLTPAHVATAEPDLRACTTVVLQGEIPPETINFASGLLERVGVRQILNLAPVVPVSQEALERADPLLVNEHEAEAVLASRGSQIPAGSVHGPQLADALIKSGIKSAIVTLGAAGAALGTEHGVARVPAPAVEAVDTTGAGDAFVGALAAALARGSDLLDAARHAARVAAFTVRGHGAQSSYPTVAATLPA